MKTVITWILSVFTFYIIFTQSKKLANNKPKIDINFDDYKENEIGDIKFQNDYKEF